ncbi:MAG: hypothetical protein IJV87_05305 [Clostridia bacterium]|nr:hypothetical protein [Clostridia bacterium]
MKKIFVKALAVLLTCMFVISGINFSIFAGDAVNAGNLGDRLVALNVSLSGRVLMSFYFTDVEENVDYYVVKVGNNAAYQVSVGSMGTSVKGTTERRVLEVSLAAAQQADVITITPYKNGVAGKVRTYSVKDYVGLAIQQGVKDEVVVAMESMLNYGAMAQKAFNYNINNLANAGMFYAETNPVNNMSVDNLYGIKKKVQTSTNESILDFSEVNAYLEGTVALRCYLNYTGDVKNLKVTIEGLNCGNDIFEENGKYYVLIDNIPATRFGHQYNIVVTDGTDTVTLKYSILNYISDYVQYGEASEAQKNTAYAMFLYYARMSEYAKGTVSNKPANCDHKRSYVKNDGTYAEICSDCGKDVTPTNIVENANKLANGVTSYFGTAAGVLDGNDTTKPTVDGDRQNYVVENNNMNFYYPLTNEESQYATITNKAGETYVEDTMDVYVKISDQKYYASNSIKSATANIYRYGYYYYDIHAYGQNFVEDGLTGEPTATQAWATSNLSTVADMSLDYTALYVNGYFKADVTSTNDPQAYSSRTSKITNTGTHNAMQITMTLESTTNVELRYVTTSGMGWADAEDAGHMLKFDTIADGKAHTYTVYFEEVVDIYGLRFDFNGQEGETVTISAINFVTIDTGSSPELLLDRGLHTYTDKMHQVLSIVAPKQEVTDIQEIGMITNVTASSVVIVDKNGNKTTVLDSGASVSNVAYAGFLTEAGVFGYILPYGDESSTIKVSYDGSTYTVTQTIVPENNTIEMQPDCNSPADLKTYKATDSSIGTSMNIYNSPTQFYFGQRIYTDTEATFDKFLEEAYIERNPLTANNIKIDTDKTPDATFDGYDGYRGMYAFTIPENIGFNAGYYYAQNFHGAVSFSVKGDSYNRNMYVMAYSYGCSIEGGAVLDGGDTLLPIPTEVSKNFDSEFEVPLYLWGDVGYSEVRIPVYVNAGETERLTVLQTYMNWGQYPLKQISSIQFFAPYYHLSTGVTESNCIANYYVKGKDLDTLPDHRAASAPFWSEETGDTNGDGFKDGDPQHDNGGYHLFLQYTDSEGNKNASEPVSSVINSAGLTYADIDMTYLSDDNKIEVTYKHLEMPQTDENRAYYEMKYTVLEDVTISDFDSQFSFYSVYGYGDGYTKFGYYGTSGAVCDVSATTTKSYVLGETCPYFDLYGITGTTGTQNADVSFLILDHKATTASGKITDDTSFIVNVANGSASLSFNVNGEVTLKAGDTITIYAMIMPWWNQAYRTNSTGAADQNVRDARENTLVNPIVATAVENATVDTSSVFLPTIKSTNGLDATFKLGHATDNANLADMNVTFRVDGFNVLATPKLYKDGELVELSSINTPDVTGSAHNYDGYFVHYDTNTGKYSYSFVTTVSGASSGTFKVVVDDTNVDWKENHSDSYLGAEAIYNAAAYGDVSIYKLSTSEVLTENGVTYVTLTNTEAGGDSHTSEFKTVGGSAVKYMVVKYRTTTHSSGLQFFMTTAGGSINGNGDIFTLSNSLIDKSGEWKVMVVDLAALDEERNLTQMVASSVGTYGIAHFRLDPFTNSAAGETIDISYIAFTRDVQAAIDMNSDMDVSNISYVYGESKSTAISGKLDELVDKTNNNYKNMNVVFSGDSLVDMMTDNNYDSDISGATLNDDGTVTVEYGSTNDRYFGFTLDGSITTGKYLVMKYRTGADTNIARGDVNVNVFCLGSTAAERTWTVHTALTKIVADHRWHTLVIDLSDLADVTEVDGSYSVTLFRGDLFDALTPNGSVDFEYIGLCDELSDIALAEDEYLEYSWQNWTASVDAINIDDTSMDTKDSASHTHPSGGAGASDRKAFYEGGKWSWTGGWVAVDGQTLTDLSVCVTDEAGIEHWTKMTYNGTTANVSNTWWENSGITEHALNNLTYGEGTIGYRVNLAADLSAYYGQTVNVSVRVITGDGYAVTVYSVFVTVPESVKDGYISGEELLDVLNTNQFSGELNDDGSLTITSTVANGDGALTLTTLVEGTPKYAVIKYKTTNPGNQVSLLATTGGLAVGGYSNFTANADGEWHTIVVDITKCERYNYGDEVSFMRLDVCEGAVGCSMTIDHVFLCEDLHDLAGEFVDATYSNNVDYVFVDGANIIGTDTNYRGESSITATVVEYTGWVGVSSFNSTGIVYVVTDEKGIETKVALANSTSEINRYYEDSNITDHLINNTKYSAGTKGYQVHFVADLTEWAGQTVTLSIREIIRGGAIIETYSVEVAIPSNEVKDPELINHPGYISGSDIHNKVNANWHTSELNSDGSVTITGNGTVNDAYIVLTDYATGLTPKYAIMRYKTTDEGSLTVLASSGSKDAGPWTGCSLITDGEWHTVVVDLTTVNNSGFVYGETVSYLRLDLCEDLDVKQSITIDYVLLCDDSDVPMTLDRNFISGDEMMGGIQSGFKGTLNDDGSLTVECTGTADGTINFNSLITGTPKYAVIRYKNTDVSQITVYAKTSTGDAHKEIYVTLKNDGMWHVAVVDLESNGKYTAGDTIDLVRFDFLDTTSSEQYVGQSLTLDYVWFTDDISRVEYEVYDKLDVSFTGKELNTQISTHGLTSNYSTALNDDGTVTFTKGTALSTEAYFTIIPSSSVDTGRYLVVKYRTTAANLKQTTIYASTTNSGAVGGDNINSIPMYNDGEWHVMVVDLTQSATVSESESIKYARIDAAYYLDQNETIEYAYIGFCDSLADVEAGYDVSFTKDTITSNGNVTFDKTEEILTVTSTGATNDAGRFWVTVPSGTVTGKYIVVRYKYNATNANNGTLVYLNTWTSTTNSGVTSGDNQKVNVLADGEWHTIVIDATKSGTVNAVDGTYSLKYVGFDFFTTSTAHEGDYVEISYIGFSDSLEDIVIEHGDVEYDLDYQFTNDNNTLGGGTHTWTSSVKTNCTSTGGNYYGWATVDGEITGMYYKIVSSTGETEWIECTSTIMGPDHGSYSTYNNASGTARTIWLGDGVDIVNAATMTIPASALSGYAPGEVVTIYVAASVDGLNGAYVVLISSEMTIA